MRFIWIKTLPHPVTNFLADHRWFLLKCSWEYCRRPCLLWLEYSLARCTHAEVLSLIGIRCLIAVLLYPPCLPLTKTRWRLREKKKKKKRFSPWRRGTNVVTTRFGLCSSFICSADCKWSKMSLPATQHIYLIATWQNWLQHGKMWSASLVQAGHRC